MFILPSFEAQRPGSESGKNRILTLGILHYVSKGYEISIRLLVLPIQKKKKKRKKTDPSQILESIKVPKLCLVAGLHSLR